jgi:Zn-dependent protease
MSHLCANARALPRTSTTGRQNRGFSTSWLRDGSIGLTSTYVFENGYLTVGSFRGIPIRFHWTTALGAFFFSGFQFAPAFWVAFVLLVLVHELGHALVVRRLGHLPLGIEVTGFGGLCRWDGSRANDLHRTIIAWGGVLAQAVLLVLTYAYSFIAGPPRSIEEYQIVSAFTRTNIHLILLNLLPFPPLDGAQAWNILGHIGRFARKR